MIDDLFDKIKDVKVFSKIDLKFSYHQLHIQEANIQQQKISYSLWTLWVYNGSFWAY